MSENHANHSEIDACNQRHLESLKGFFRASTEACEQASDISSASPLGASEIHALLDLIEGDPSGWMCIFLARFGDNDSTPDNKRIDALEAIQRAADEIKGTLDKMTTLADEIRRVDPDITPTPVANPTPAGDEAERIANWDIPPSPGD